MKNVDSLKFWLNKLFFEPIKEGGSMEGKILVLTCKKQRRINYGKGYIRIW